MPYEVLARRWRPLTFADVVGQDHVTQTLASAVEQDRVAHAFLLTGIRGVGKTTVARLLARSLNCSDRKEGEPCNQCPSCEQILKGASVDVIEIDGASNRGIDEVRDLIEAARYLPSSSLLKIYIIDEVHQLTLPAFNALLKLLEEPPPHVKFILATTDVHRLPPTVLSRCQRYDFRRVSSDEITAHLGYMAEKESLDVSTEALTLVAREAGGSMRDAQSLLDQITAAAGPRVEAEDAARLLGVAGRTTIAAAVEAVVDGNARRLVEIAFELRSAGADPERFLGEILEMLRHLAVAAAAGTGALSAGLGESERALVERLHGRRSHLDLQRIFASLLDTAERLRRGSVPELVMEMGLLKAAGLERVSSAAEILERIERLGGGGLGPPPPRGPASGGAGESKGGGAEFTPSGGEPTALAPESAAGSAAHIAEAREGEGGAAEDCEWEAFLAMVNERLGATLYVAVSNCELHRPADNKIELRPLAATFRSTLEKAETLRALEEVAAAHFDRQVSMEITQKNGDGSAGMSVERMEAERRARVEAEALADPLVSGAVDRLGGKVAEIKPIDD